MHTEDMQWDSSRMMKPKSLTDFMKSTQKSKASSPKCQKYADDLSAERECIELSVYGDETPTIS